MPCAISPADYRNRHRKDSTKETEAGIDEAAYEHGRWSGTIAQRFRVRLWFAPASEVPIYRQLVIQVVLAILAGDLKPGERLPSTRELARRFALHPNTVSAGYRQLERDGWTEGRHGSGVY